MDAHGCPFKVHLTMLWVNHGHARTGPIRDLKGVAYAWTGPSVPMLPRTNPVRDQSGNIIWVRVDRLLLYYMYIGY